MSGSTLPRRRTDRPPGATRRATEDWPWWAFPLFFAGVGGVAGAVVCAAAVGGPPGSVGWSWAWAGRGLGIGLGGGLLLGLGYASWERNDTPVWVWVPVVIATLAFLAWADPVGLGLYLLAPVAVLAVVALCSGAVGLFSGRSRQPGGAGPTSGPPLGEPATDTVGVAATNDPTLQWSEEELRRLRGRRLPGLPSWLLRTLVAAGLCGVLGVVAGAVVFTPPAAHGWSWVGATRGGGVGLVAGAGLGLSVASTKNETPGWIGVPVCVLTGILLALIRFAR